MNMKSKTCVKLLFVTLAGFICAIVVMVLTSCNEEVPGINVDSPNDVINNITVEVNAPKPVIVETENKYPSINNSRIYFVPLKNYYNVTIIITTLTFVDRLGETFITVDIPYLIADQPYSIETPNYFLSLVSIIGYEIN